MFNYTFLIKWLLFVDYFSLLKTVNCVNENRLFIDNTTDKYLIIKNNDYIDKAFRSDRPSREPRFLSFETKDSSIEVEMDFAIPFLSIPIKKSIDAAMNGANSVISGIPLANLNVGAVVLTGIVAAVGTLIGAFFRFFQHDIKGTPGSILFNKSGQRTSNRESKDNMMWEILYVIEKSLMKYDIDSIACTQRIICWYTKNASINVADGNANNMEKIINGLANSKWALDIMSGTAIEDAIIMARRGNNCEYSYPGCNLSLEHIKKLANIN